MKHKLVVKKTFHEDINRPDDGVDAAVSGSNKSAKGKNAGSGKAKAAKQKPVDGSGNDAVAGSDS